MRTGPPRSTCACAWVAFATWLAASAGFASHACAQASVAREPPRYLATLTLGVPLRLARHVEFDQGVIAPVYSDALGGYVLSSTARVRHGIGLGASLNLSDDGGYTEPVRVARQLVVMPAYLAYWAASDDWFGLGHVGIPVVASEGRSVGLELAFGAGYRWLAGFGVYGEAAFDVFAGGASTVHPTLALELGVFLEHEVLP